MIRQLCNKDVAKKKKRGQVHKCEPSKNIIYKHISLSSHIYLIPCDSNSNYKIMNIYKNIMKYLKITMRTIIATKGVMRINESEIKHC